jgi:hypothetical protein
MTDDRCRLVKPIEDRAPQTHYCILPKGHEQQTHRCPCSHEWVE